MRFIGIFPKQFHSEIPFALAASFFSTEINEKPEWFLLKFKNDNERARDFNAKIRATAPRIPNKQKNNKPLDTKRIVKMILLCSHIFHTF